MENTPHLNPDHIVDDTFFGYKVVDLAKKDQNKVIDQIIDIKEKVEDLQILKTWVEWFRSKYVAYVITYHNGVYTLWKEFVPDPYKKTRRVKKRRN